MTVGEAQVPVSGTAAVLALPGARLVYEVTGEGPAVALVRLAPGSRMR